MDETNVRKIIAMNMRTKKLVFLLLLLSAFSVYAQVLNSISLSNCQQWAKANYPLTKQRDLLLQSRDFNLSNASKAYLPQIQLMAQASYQSEVTKIPIPMPGVAGISKDQYKVYAELNQTLYDGGLVKNQKKIQNAIATIDVNKLEVDLYALQEKINQLYFGILLFEAQLKQNDLIKSDIDAAIKRMEAAVNYGTTLKSTQNVLQAERLKVAQRTIELKAFRKAYLDMLSLFINQKLGENIVLEKPASLALVEEIKRPELTLFTSMGNLYKAQASLLNAKNLPKLNFFAQAGYGRPALNMLNNDFTNYYIGGVRLNWNFSGLYTLHNEKDILEINRKIVSVQQETFLFNTQTQLQQQNAELEKLNALIVSDAEIVSLRKQIKESAAAQLENGIIQANDYLREVNAEDLAQQAKITHEIQLLLVQYAQQTTKGN